MKIETRIKQLKKALIKKAKKNGLYENFGDKEQRKLKDEYIDISSYTDEMNKNRDLVQAFNEWCYSFDDNSF